MAAVTHQPVLSDLKLNKVRLSAGMGDPRKTLLLQEETPVSQEMAPHPSGTAGLGPALTP